MSKTLDQTLQQIFNTIESNLKTKVEHAFKEEEQKQLKKIGLTKKFEELEKLKTQYAEIDHAIDQLNHQINQEKGWYSGKVKKGLQNLGCTNYRPNQIEVHAYERVAQRPEGQNYLAFRKIEENIRTMYSLAISSKEKREIILGLQNQPWRELGIDLPPFNALESLEIKNGGLSISGLESLPESH